jgi:ribosomal protein L7/L12
MDDAALARRFGAIEEQLKLISEHLGLASPPFAGAAGDGDGAVPADVLELARGGKETQAISRLRQLTGMSLLEAKRVVDGL